MSTHPAFATRFPPADDTFSGVLMLKVAAGLDDLEDLQEMVAELIEDDEFPEVFPDEDEPTVAEALALLDEVVAEHDRVVTEPTADLLAFLRAIETLVAEGIGFSLGEGINASEASEAGLEAAQELAQETGRPSKGYAYSHLEDVDRAVLSDVLPVGFGGMDGSPDSEVVAIGRRVADVLTAAGLPVEWDGDPDRRIIVSPLSWAEPFGED
ncbi:hypothetical protein RDV89_06235 [Nocardioides zeae]|uniref:DUF6891 domain-containing protein n=1 Tax=Nocardioides imazamoxiresistens TaxID=3231893 RepID=A0ABU3PTW4_9ACTN|nr:hypothetical protein [Nocardioides zeae]MDT9592655.1 hypothetical protein [Nocardioides zeae]